MPRYIIHIGPHKTATTYLQRAFRLLQPAFRERGIFYPPEWLGDQGPGHYVLAKKLRSPEAASLAEAFARLNSAGHEAILISAEDLSRLTSEEIRQFKAMIGSSEATIVHYLRRWSDVIVSDWQGGVKRGETMSLAERVSGFMAKPEDPVINPEILLDRFAEHFGIDHTRIVCYDVLMDQKVELLDHFLKTFLGFSEPPELDRGRRNASLNSIDTEILRALNIIGSRKDANFKVIRAAEFVAARATLELGPVEAAMKGDLAPVPIRDRVRVLGQMHNRLLKRYKHAIVEPFIPKQLFPPAGVKKTYVEGHYVFTPGAVECLNAAFAKLRP